MNLKEALQETSREATCKVGRWLADLDQTDRDALETALLDYELNRVWRAAKLMGFTGSNMTWYRHFQRSCQCD